MICLEDFVKDHERALRNFALSLTRSEDESDDLLQDTWLKCIVYQQMLEDVTGQVSIGSATARKSIGSVLVTNDYLTALEDDSKLSVVGSVTLEDSLNPELFTRKIAELVVVGSVKCPDVHEVMLRKVLKESKATKLSICKQGYKYVPSGTKIDSFSLMTTEEQTVSCTGQLIIEEDESAAFDRVIKNMGTYVL